jgi:hypothetical protein
VKTRLLFLKKHILFAILFLCGGQLSAENKELVLNNTALSSVIQKPSRAINTIFNNINDDCMFNTKKSKNAPSYEKQIDMLAKNHAQQIALIAQNVEKEASSVLSTNAIKTNISTFINTYNGLINISCHIKFETQSDITKNCFSVSMYNVASNTIFLSIAKTIASLFDNANIQEIVKEFGPTCLKNAQVAITIEKATETKTRSTSNFCQWEHIFPQQKSRYSWANIASTAIHAIPKFVYYGTMLGSLYSLPTMHAQANIHIDNNVGNSVNYYTPTNQTCSPNEKFINFALSKKQELGQCTKQISKEEFLNKIINQNDKKSNKILDTKEFIIDFVIGLDKNLKKKKISLITASSILHDFKNQVSTFDKNDSEFLIAKEILKISPALRKEAFDIINAIAEQNQYCDEAWNLAKTEVSVNESRINMVLDIFKTLLTKGKYVEEIFEIAKKLYNSPSQTSKKAALELSQTFKEREIYLNEKNNFDKALDKNDLITIASIFNKMPKAFSLSKIPLAYQDRLSGLFERLFNTELIASILASQKQHAYINDRIKPFSNKIDFALKNKNITNALNIFVEMSEANSVCFSPVKHMWELLNSENKDAIITIVSLYQKELKSFEKGTNYLIEIGAIMFLVGIILTINTRSNTSSFLFLRDENEDGSIYIDESIIHISSSTLTSAYANNNNPLLSGDREKCAICLEEPMDLKDGTCCLTPCRHIFHIACLNTWINMAKTCPTCKQEFKIEQLTALKK